MLQGSSVGNRRPERHAYGPHNNGEAGHCQHDLDEQRGIRDLKGKNQKQMITLHQLEPLALQALHELVSTVHESVNVSCRSQSAESTYDHNSAVNVKGEYKKLVTADLFRLEDDPVANILWNLEPLVLQNVLLAMLHNFPRTLEALILHMLSPVGAEVLTQKFDEMDQQITKEERNDFYQAFYGIFDDQFAAMDVILRGKESFALQAFRNVLDQYLGVKYDGSKLSVG